MGRCCSETAKVTAFPVVALIPEMVVELVVMAFPLVTVIEELFLKTMPSTKYAFIPVVAVIFTLSNNTSEIDCSGRPHKIPELGEPEIVMFFNVMCCQVGVVAVIATAGSAVGEPGTLG